MQHIKDKLYSVFSSTESKIYDAEQFSKTSQIAEKTIGTLKILVTSILNYGYEASSPR